ncbi:MAG: alpha-L-rhamnosidase [Rikenellaceae bacterium]|nr:alpha-L-rhamnosidase [Rikenellaceae bacterium]
MKRLLLLLCLVWAMPTMAQVTLSELKVNHLAEPEGVVDDQPVFSWIISSAERGVSQSAYEIVVYEGNSRVWSSGKVASDNSITAPYEGKPLRSSTRYTWRVRVWDNTGKVSKWASSTFLTGLYSKDEWQAKWIEPKLQDDRSPLLRKSFTLKKKVASAVMHVTAHGLYEASLNGEKVGDALLTPGWTAYNKRLQYQTYDVTDMLSRGENVFGLELGYGWYHSRMCFHDRKDRYMYNIHQVGALAQINITYTDGTKECIVTDSSWVASTGEILHSTLYDGEITDGRLEKQGWNTTAYDASAWEAVNEAEYSLDELVASESEQVKVRQRVKPVALITTPAGEKVLDFGQNLVGHEVVKVNGKAGQEILFSHAEVLDEKGNFYTINLRTAKAQRRHICTDGEQTITTKFTWYGFRYLKVEGIEDINLEDFEAEVIFSDFSEIGDFTSSNQLVNQLQSNIRWGMRGNFVDVPTDCPQRDERMGWTGDANVFFRTASFLGDVQNFFIKWLRDLALDQWPGGEITDLVPCIPGWMGAGRTVWADAGVTIPWQHYMAYGDKRVLENQYESMKRWIDYMFGNCNNYLWNTGWHYGDWLFYSADNDFGGDSAVTYRPLIQQCFMVRSAEQFVEAAKVLGKDDVARRYARTVEKCKEAFCRAYLTPGGYLVSNTQTAYAIALEFDMVPDEVRPVLAQRLADEVRRYGHITTGFAGTPFICHALSNNGYTDLAYHLLLHEGYPGWLYSVKMGGTTIWELWDSMKPDRTIPDTGMNSFNHYSKGAIGDWLYREAVGLKETSAGYKSFMVQPKMGGGFSHMAASTVTPYGKASADWRFEGGRFKLDVTVPVNTTAEVYVPSHAAEIVKLDGVKVEEHSAVKVLGNDGSYTHLQVGSGEYSFRVLWD